MPCEISGPLTGSGLCRRNYFDQTDALIYVIDSADSKRLSESEFELTELLQVGGEGGGPDGRWGGGGEGRSRGRPEATQRVVCKKRGPGRQPHTALLGVLSDMACRCT